MALFAPGTAEQDILSSFPLVGEVDVRRTFKRTVEVVLRERKEIAVWCSAQSVCFSMDKEGVVFEKKDPAAKDFVIYDYIEKASVALGQKALEGDLLSFVVLFKNSIESSRILKEEGVEFHSLSLLSDTRIHWKSSQGWQAYTNPKGDASWQFTKLEAVIDKKISSAQRGNLDYIELRFGDQAYIKYE
ncbi:MAG: hypothetical protein HYT50_02015 [Candidatus Wildermuthbacteria bacterium]|nr:hypothetical protein [Candidatus Wildermuthbacteria bacterium]